MRVLAFDTATALTTVALRGEGVDLAAVDDPAPGGRPGHAQRLLALIHDLLEQAGSGWEEIDRIAVGTGPGTFTGLRIGIATAQALAAATGTPLVGVSTLRSLALAARDGTPARATLAVVDARRGEVFAAGWAPGENPLDAASALAPCVLAPEQLARVGAAGGAQAVGDGAVKYRELLEAAGAHVPGDGAVVHRVSAREHCRLAALAQPPADGRIEPQYLRLPDAEVAKV